MIVISFLRLMEMLDYRACNICPRACGVDRQNGVKGFCGCGPLPRVAYAGLHLWEEPVISGAHGSGAVFFSGCGLRCVYCQNHAISHTVCGQQYDAAALSRLFLELQAKGAHNINLVTPSPHVPVLADAIALARKSGLAVPVVYNTSGYDAPDTLDRLDGLVDIYLPDLKYCSPEYGDQFSGAPDYFEHASKAVLKMYGQVGTLRMDADGVAEKGLLIRHLVLPCSLSQTRGVLSFIADRLPKDTYISLMGQYFPAHRAKEYAPISRPLTEAEYGRAMEFCRSLGFSNVFVQSLASADSCYVPPFAVENDG